MSNFVDDLKKYFEQTPMTQVLKDWEATREDVEYNYDSEPHCTAGACYSGCEIHHDRVNGCLDCGNYKIPD